MWLWFPFELYEVCMLIWNIPFSFWASLFQWVTLEEAWQEIGENTSAFISQGDPSFSFISKIQNHFVNKWVGLQSNQYHLVFFLPLQSWCSFPDLKVDDHWPNSKFTTTSACSCCEYKRQTMFITLRILGNNQLKHTLHIPPPPPQNKRSRVCVTSPFVFFFPLKSDK